jgi:hypothetical protein
MLFLDLRVWDRRSKKPRCERTRAAQTVGDTDFLRKEYGRAQESALKS